MRNVFENFPTQKVNIILKKSNQAIDTTSSVFKFLDLFSNFFVKVDLIIKLERLINFD
jgi:hypothetical protein